MVYYKEISGKQFFINFIDLKYLCYDEKSYQRHLKIITESKKVSIPEFIKKIDEDEYFTDDNLTFGAIIYQKDNILLVSDAEYFGSNIYYARTKVCLDLLKSGLFDNLENIYIVL